MFLNCGYFKRKGKTVKTTKGGKKLAKNIHLKDKKNQHV